MQFMACHDYHKPWQLFFKFDLLFHHGNLNLRSEPMKLKGSEHRYGVIALLLIGLSGLGLYMVELSYYDADYKSSVDLHRSLGG